MKTSYDIAIIGAGAAGVMASSAAASRGARVVLFEASDRLGGAVTTAMHRSLCGLYATTPRSPTDTLNDGAQRRFIERLVAKAPELVQPKQFGKAWVLEFPSAAYEASLAETLDEANVEPRMRSRVTRIRREGQRVSAIQIESDWIEIKFLIDCTGGGKVLELIGDDAMLLDDGPNRMLGGYAVRLTGLTGDMEILRLLVPYALSKAVQTGELPKLSAFTVFYPGPNEGEGVCKLAMPADETSPADAAQFAQQTIAYLKREVGGFADARVIEQSPSAIPRDGRRLRGRYIVTEEDVLSARKRNGKAVRAWWPIERWDPSDGPTYAYPPEGEYYDIPDDTLRSATIENLLAAGSCLSATAGAAASLRASGICLATGDAAGRLAASF